MKTAEAAKGHWPEILKYYGLPPITGKKHFKGECPVCGARGKFRIDDRDGNGTWICVCGSGDGLKLITLTQKRAFSEICAEIDGITGNKYRKTGNKQPVTSTQESLRVRVQRRFSSLKALQGTSGAEYLRSRGIFSLPVEAIRFNSQQIYNGRMYQSLYALATDDRGELCYLHQTLLDGDKKADIGISARRLKSLQDNNYLDHASSVAIRMFPVASTLGIAEGIETALSAHQIYNVNTWATINSGFMKKFRVPAGVTHLIIFADRDEYSATGMAAACECAHANLQARNDLHRVSVYWPDHDDFNTMLMNGDQVRELVFYRKKAAA